MDGLTVGRLVHYVVAPGECRSALIVRVFTESTNPEMGIANLQVFVDGQNDERYLPLQGVKLSDGAWWCTSAHYSEAHERFTWHWPERV